MENLLLICEAYYRLQYGETEVNAFYFIFFVSPTIYSNKYVCISAMY